MNKILLDTGFWVALIDKSEKKHKISIDWLKNYQGVIYSTEAVFTEVLYLFNFSWLAQQNSFDFILSGAVQLVPSNLGSIQYTKKIMKKYADIPMDYADASLVCLAKDTKIFDILTFDKDFQIYRIEKTNFRKHPSF